LADISSLLMDDSRPLGNTQDVFNKRALHVKIGNSSSEAVPVSISEIGTPFFVDAPAQTTTPGTEQLLLTTTNAANETLYLKKIDVICRTEGTFKCKIDGSIVASGRTGAAKPTALFVWQITRQVSPSSTFEIYFTARTGAPASDVEAYLQGTKVTT